MREPFGCREDHRGSVASWCDIRAALGLYPCPRWLSPTRRRSPPTPRSRSSSAFSSSRCSFWLSSPRHGPFATTGPAGRPGCSVAAKRRRADRRALPPVLPLVMPPTPPEDAAPTAPEPTASEPTVAEPTLGQRIRARWARWRQRGERQHPPGGRGGGPGSGPPSSWRAAAAAVRCRSACWRSSSTAASGPIASSARRSAPSTAPPTPAVPTLEGMQHLAEILAPDPGDRHLPARHLRRTLGLLPEARRRARQHGSARHHRGRHRLHEPRGRGDPARGGDDFAHRRSRALDLERARRRGRPRLVGDPVDLSRRSPSTATSSSMVAWSTTSRSAGP